MGAEDFSAVLDVNLSGAFRVARGALKRMSRQRVGHIVFIGSFSAFRGPAGQSNYAAAKAGLIALAQSLAREYGARNIRVNCVLPGFMETKMTSHLGDGLRAQFREEHMLGRFNTADEAARFVRFLHLEMPHTSGQVFSLDSRPHRWT
jgi:3-oxoacyl-[acyl-carrier protein] reductase